MFEIFHFEEHGISPDGRKMTENDPNNQENR